MNKEEVKLNNNIGEIIMEDIKHKEILINEVKNKGDFRTMGIIFPADFGPDFSYERNVEDIIEKSKIKLLGEAKEEGERCWKNSIKWLQKEDNIHFMFEEATKLIMEEFDLIDKEYRRLYHLYNVNNYKSEEKILYKAIYKKKYSKDTIAYKIAKKCLTIILIGSSNKLKV